MRHRNEETQRAAIQLSCRMFMTAYAMWLSSIIMSWIMRHETGALCMAATTPIAMAGLLKHRYKTGLRILR